MRFDQFEKPPAIVLGLGQNGMATCRSLGRVGVPVIGIDSDLEQPGAQTKYCAKVRCKDFAKAGPGLIEALLDIGKQLNHKAVIIPSGDLNLVALSENREALAPYFHFSLPSKEIVRLFLNKKAFYQFCMREGFTIPGTFFTDGEGKSSIEEIMARVAYPCLMKPFQPTAAWRQAFDTRLFLADSPEMLKSLFDLIFPVHQDLVVQDYMPGDDSNLYWGVTYLDRNQQPLATWTGRKLRQYPRGFGTATLAESLHEPWVAEESVRILRAMGHVGYGVVEYKKDRRDGKLKITEATGGRTWFPHSIVERSGINLPYILYRDVLGLPPEPQRAYRAGIRWIHEERDLKTVFLYFLPEGKLTYASWLQSYRGKRVYAYAAWDDPKPFLTSASRIARAGWTRIKRRLTSTNPEKARVQVSRPKQLQELLLAADPTVGHGLRKISVD